MRQPLDRAVCHSMGASVHSRVVGLPSLQAGMSPVEQNLEDGYVWFMRDPFRAFAQDVSANRAV